MKWILFTAILLLVNGRISGDELCLVGTDNTLPPTYKCNGDVGKVLVDEKAATMKTCDCPEETLCKLTNTGHDGTDNYIYKCEREIRDGLVLD